MPPMLLRVRAPWRRAASFLVLSHVIATGPPVLAQPAAAPAGRVVLVSLDGLGAEALADGSPAADALPRLRALAARGVRARGVQPHTPSTTANTHAALWTGAWGDVNGISGNTMPVPPREAHTIVERTVGFRADHLRAEPVWVTAARQGVRTVVQQASQSYPFVPATVGTGASRPVILNGYQTRVISPARVIRPADVTHDTCAGEAPDGPCITWDVGPLRFHGRFERAGDATGVMRLHIGSPQATGTVHADAHPAEAAAPLDGRPLARHFSDGLLVDRADGAGPVMVYFRLFAATPDGADFVLYQTAIHELALHDGGRDTRDDVLRLLREAGGFLGNAGGYLWERPDAPLGPAMAEGGDGTAERRFLETIEIAVRQVHAHTRWLWHRYDPRLLVAYTSLPDELEHRLLALSQADPRYLPFRRWGYALVDATVGMFAELASAPDDHLVFVSDHGLAAVTHEVRPGVVLQQAGLLVLDGSGRIDVARTQVVPIRNCLMVNGTEWKDGIVAPARREAVLSRALDALRALRDPATGAPLVTKVVRGDADRRALGFGGPTGADACYGLAEGYAVDESALRGEPVARRRFPKGDHNFLGTRREMQGVLIAAGPALPAATEWPAVRAIDVAPLVTDLLGVAPPAGATGASPLRMASAAP